LSGGAKAWFRPSGIGSIRTIVNCYQGVSGTLLGDRNLYSFSFAGGDQGAGPAMAKFDDFPALLCELATIKVAYFTFRAAKAHRNPPGVVANDGLGSD
jgi:hypothetical protein